MEVRIDYYFWSDVDTWVRLFGRSIDEPLNHDWYVTQPDNTIGEAARSFSYSETVDLPEGEHYVECRTSGYAEEYPEYRWRVKVTVNGLDVGEDTCGRDKAARFAFQVEEAPADSWWLPVGVAASLGAVAVVGLIAHQAVAERV